MMLPNPLLQLKLWSQQSWSQQSEEQGEGEKSRRRIGDWPRIGNSLHHSVRPLSVSKNAPTKRMFHNDLGFWSVGTVLFVFASRAPAPLGSVGTWNTCR